MFGTDIYESAQRTLKSALGRVGATSFMVSPNLLLHPLELVEGGLSQIEDRVLRELAVGAGAKKAMIWIGAELSDGEVSAKLTGG
jgi:rod shape-determining protein MreB and related proteins